MEKTQITADTPLHVGHFKIVPVIRVVYNTWTQGSRSITCGSKQPVAIVFFTQNERKILRVSGEEMSLQELIEEFPETRNIFDI